MSGWRDAVVVGIPVPEEWSMPAADNEVSEAKTESTLDRPLSRYSVERDDSFLHSRGSVGHDLSGGGDAFGTDALHEVLNDSMEVDQDFNDMGSGRFGDGDTASVGSSVGRKPSPPRHRRTMTQMFEANAEEAQAKLKVRGALAACTPLSLK